MQPPLGITFIRMTTVPVPGRASTVRRGKWLNWATLGYNSLEGVLSVGAAIVAGSVALLGFGIDSFIEVGASLAAIWRLQADPDEARRIHVERRSLRLIGFSFLLLAAYVAFDATGSLWQRAHPTESALGIAVAVASLIVMPVLARAKRRVATALGSGALTAEARQTEICVYLSVLLLLGLGLNAAVGWWWADPVAALAMVPLIAWEGIGALRGRSSCAECAPLGAA